MAPTAAVDSPNKPAVGTNSIRESVPNTMNSEIPRTSVASLTHHGPTRSKSSVQDDYRSAATSSTALTDSSTAAHVSGLQTEIPHTRIASLTHFGPTMAGTFNTLQESAQSKGGYIISRVSPLTVLYPESMIPTSAPGPQTLDTSMQSSSIDYEFPFLPVGFKIVLFLGMGLGLIWALVVYWVNFPPAFFTTKLSFKLKRAPKKKRKSNIKKWCMNWVPGWVKNARKDKQKRAVDKQSMYAPVPTSASSTSTLSSSSLVLGSLRSASNGSVVELRSRNPPRLFSPAPSRPPQTPTFLLRQPFSGPITREESQKMNPYLDSLTKLQGRKKNVRSASSPSLVVTTALPMPIRAPLQTSIQRDDFRPPSPHNPFLPTLRLKPKSSAEWLREREVFLAEKSAPTSSTSIVSDIDHSTKQPSNAHSTCDPDLLHLGDMGSMEAQVADGGSKRNSILGYCRYLGSRISYSMKDHKKRDSWLDVVDGVVTKLAGKVAKWTADDGGNEGLLLPLSKGRVD